MVILPFGVLFSSLSGAICPGLFGVNLNVDEDLPNYFEALEQDDKFSMIKEEENMRKNYVSTNIWMHMIYL